MVTAPFRHVDYVWTSFFACLFEPTSNIFFWNGITKLILKAFQNNLGKSSLCWIYVLKHEDAKKMEKVIICNKVIKVFGIILSGFYHRKVGLLRHQDYMKPLGKYRTTMSYCRYGFKYRKNTDLWTNITYEPKPCLKDTVIDASFP